MCHHATAYICLLILVHFKRERERERDRERERAPVCVLILVLYSTCLLIQVHQLWPQEHTLTYAHVCSRVLTYAHSPSLVAATATRATHVCSSMLTHTDVCYCDSNGFCCRQRAGETASEREGLGQCLQPSQLSQHTHHCPKTCLCWKY
jgi:hypothetical protein